MSISCRVQWSSSTSTHILYLLDVELVSLFSIRQTEALYSPDQGTKMPPRGQLTKIAKYSGKYYKGILLVIYLFWPLKAFAEPRLKPETVALRVRDGLVSGFIPQKGHCPPGPGVLPMFRTP